MGKRFGRGSLEKNFISLHVKDFTGTKSKIRKNTFLTVTHFLYLNFTNSFIYLIISNEFMLSLYFFQ